MLAFDAGRRLREFLRRAPKLCAALGRASVGRGDTGDDGGDDGIAGRPLAALLLSSGMLSTRKRRPFGATNMLRSASWAVASTVLRSNPFLFLLSKRAENGTVASSTAGRLGAAEGRRWAAIQIGAAQAHPLANRPCSSV